RIDSGDLAKLGAWCLGFFEANGLDRLMPVLTGNLDVEGVRQIVEAFPEAAGFGIGTKLSSEVEFTAGVIFKESMIDGYPTLKASHNPEKATLPGRLQVFRGIDRDGLYVGDYIGLDDERVEIAGAARVERLLLPFWENGHYDVIPSITKQKAFVEEQRKRFPDISNYRVELSAHLRGMRDELTAKMREDLSGWRDVLNLPDSLSASVSLLNDR
ncbi:MAG TPA: hypothetical protein VKC34_02535, partial [Blastocatellia bacterium]|nr:hypothetical protein [Blastocatellia bacterium]